MSSAEVRPARDADVPAVASIWYAGWLDGHTGLVPPELIAHRTPESFVPRARERVPTTWVAEFEGAVVGFVVVIDDEVEQIYLDAAARGSGAATQLLRQAEDVIRTAGHRIAWLAVVDGNERARRFYTRHGWTDQGPFAYDAQIPGGTLPVPCRRYETDLARQPLRQTLRTGHQHPSA